MLFLSTIPKEHRSSKITSITPKSSGENRVSKGEGPNVLVPALGASSGMFIIEKESEL